jgi:hypothetical protein
MADTDRPKLSSCPICGYTDTSADAQALEQDIMDHIRSAHNLEPSAALAPTVQDAAGVARAGVNEPPAAAPVGSVGTNTTGQMAPPNLGHAPTRGVPGDPQTQARDPLSTDSNSEW